ncbi:cell growth regulator with EF hand domain protein 1 [Polypterus senegalus]|uniref:cell growth regulator with EF hand domain protein 1 n=1 Tax=Polypterus senegalus TaxID=55291 RepID=UPI001962AFF1|nr:cell growth regulator with EF hand domain protein 1 [Polypterus senegalus]
MQRHNNMHAQHDSLLTRANKQMFQATLLSLFLFVQHYQTAPQSSGPYSSESETGNDTLTLTVPNPFGSSQEEHRLLQSYIQSRFSEGHGNPDKMTWEQEVFSIFSLHDYDKSGQMDGLELMKMLSDFLSHHYMPQTSAESVILMVDALLQTQDDNQDGLLNPSEILARTAEVPAVNVLDNDNTLAKEAILPPHLKDDSERNLQDNLIQEVESISHDLEKKDEDRNHVESQDDQVQLDNN